MPALIVEDDRITADLVTLIVKRAGIHEVHVQDTAEGALAHIDRVAFELILVDWMLPGISGLHVVRRARRSALNKEAPILMVTSKNEAHDVLEAISAGANGFVLKPFDSDYMVRQIRKATGRSDEVSSQPSGRA